MILPVIPACVHLTTRHLSMNYNVDICLLAILCTSAFIILIYATVYFYSIIFQIYCYSTSPILLFGNYIY